MKCHTGQSITSPLIPARKNTNSRGYFVGVKYLDIIMINNSGFNSMDNAHADNIKTMFPEVLATVEGYDAEKTRVLKNVSGTLTWVDESTGG